MKRFLSRQHPAWGKLNTLTIALALCLSLTGCDRKINSEEQEQCIEAVQDSGLDKRVQGFHIDEYGYLCCVMEIKDLYLSADEEALALYGSACQPPIKGVKIINATDGKVLGKYKRDY